MKTQPFEFNYLEYKNKTSKKIAFPISILIIIIILLSALIIYVKPEKNYQLYFVELNAFPTYIQANDFATEVKQKNGAGYIYYSTKYHVFANFYCNKKDAESVLSNVKNVYQNSKIYTISLKILKSLKNLGKNQAKSIKNTANFLNFLISELSALSIDYDNTNINFYELQTNFKNLSEKFETYYSNFCKQFQYEYQANTSKKYLTNIHNSLQTLSNLDNNCLACEIKYLCIEIVINYSSFLSLF